jgi:hypothetical protein
MTLPICQIGEIQVHFVRGLNSTSLLMEGLPWIYQMVCDAT